MRRSTNFLLSQRPPDEARGRKLGQFQVDFDGQVSGVVKLISRLPLIAIDH